MKGRAIRFAAAAMAALLCLCGAALTEGQISYRIADRSEGAALLLGNDAYFEGFSQADLDYRVQKKGATVEEWKSFAAEQVLDFTDAEAKALRSGMAAIEAILDENGYSLPKLDELIFVKTTQLEEGGSDAYTLGNQIYLGEGALEALGGGSRGGLALLCHELFHCLTRNNPGFRRDMYAILGFAVHEEEFELPPVLRAIRYSNPDVGRHDASASFAIGGGKEDCFVALIAAQPFEQPGDSFMYAVEPVLVPVDGADTYYLPEDAANFWDVFGRNTGYVLDPEECLADNFAFALLCGDEDLSGEPFPNPEILDAMRAYLKG